MDFKVRQKIFVLICFSILTFTKVAWSAPIDVSASVRTLGAFSDHFTSPSPLAGTHPGDVLSYTQARLILQGDPPFLGIPFSYDIHGIAEYIANSQSQSSSVQGFSTSDAYRSHDISYTPVDHPHQHLALTLDRFQLKFGLPFVDIAVGRQAVDFSKTYFWNVLDVFNPFTANQYDRDYKRGVDALRFDFPINSTSGINVIGALGRKLFEEDVSWQGSAIFGRGFTNVKGFDFSLQGGKVRGGYHSGLGIVGEVGVLETRAEGAWFLADDKTTALPFPLDQPFYKSHFSSVVGVGHHFQNTLDIQAEYFFNGGGSRIKDFDAAFVRAGNGEILNWGKHLSGVSLAYEFLPILTGQLGYLFSFTDASSELLPQLKWSISDNIDFLAGAITHFGKRPNGQSALGLGLRSEFASQSDFYYLQLKTYF